MTEIPAASIETISDLRVELYSRFRWLEQQVEEQPELLPVLVYALRIAHNEGVDDCYDYLSSCTGALCVQIELLEATLEFLREGLTNIAKEIPKTCTTTAKR